MVLYLGSCKHGVAKQGVVKMGGCNLDYVLRGVERMGVYMFG